MLVSQRDADQLAKWKERAHAAGAQPSLFDDPHLKKPSLEVVPWRFRYRYRCLDPGCGGHQQTIVDWEIAALWRKVRYQSNWRELMHEKLIQTMWDQSRDTVLFVGNMHQHPQSFLILGIFWPPNSPLQPSLLG